MMMRTTLKGPAVPFPKAAIPLEIKPLAVSIPEFCRIASIGRSLAYSMIREGKVESRHLGRRTVILMRSIETLLKLNEGQG